jgi:hypothetical protein
MSKTVFWSWQSDRDNRVTRNLIREALVVALARLSDVVDIEDRLEIDHDTRGIPGSPDIVSSILQKIDAADVFVADVTPITVSENGKHIANPNVLIELGYAKKSLGPSRWVTVWNTAFTDCKVEDLPFDLRGKRGPVTYTLPAGATKDELKQARMLLVDQFAERISGSLKSLPSAALPASSNWHPFEQEDRSVWKGGNLPIAINEEEESGTKELAQGPRWYVRILPSKFDHSNIDNGAYASLPQSSSNGGFSWGFTQGGTITYGGSVRSAGANLSIIGATMWFRSTGEVWTTQARVSYQNNGLAYFVGDDLPPKWAKFLWFGLNSLEKQGGEGPFKVRFGVTGLTGLYWSTEFGRMPPIALQGEMEYEFEVGSSVHTEWNAHLLSSWRELRSIFGRPPPTQADIDRVLGMCR